ncbi:MAG: dihydrodipicolinate synthase family protein, partial [Clostridia bacterium]|nr:dihydrodipicolinate synthase family protein [Clostridia bacterium]
PREMARLCELWRDGDIWGARRAQLELLPLIDALFCETNPIPLKYALSRLGLCSGAVRLPLTEPSESVKAKVDKALLKFAPACEKE